MENRFGTPASGTPEWSARREFELLLLLGGSRKAAVQLWLRKQRIYANAQQAAGRPAREAKGSRGAAERQAGGESKPETAAQARAAAPQRAQAAREAPRAQDLGCGEGAQAPQQVVRASASSGREAACTIIYDINSGGCPATSTAATSSCAGPGAGPSDAARRRRCSCLFSA